MSTTHSATRQALVRTQLKKMGVDGYVLPRGDEYLGEYVAPYAERLAWLTGFTGSAGLAILLKNGGAVFSDGRYGHQLRQQVDPTLWETYHMHHEPAREWLERHAKGCHIGYYPKLVSEVFLANLCSSSVTLVPLDQEPIDSVWSDQPNPPTSAVALYEQPFSGETSLHKREQLTATMRQLGADAYLICDPTSLAWVLNIRGDDVPHTPIVQAFGILYQNGTLDLFLQGQRVSDKVKGQLDSVSLQDVNTLAATLRSLKGKTVFLDPTQASVWFIQILNEAGAVITRGTDLCALPRAKKTKKEQHGAREIQKLDTAALCEFLYFVSREGVGKRETELAEILHSYRSTSHAYRGESFPAISAAGPHAALPHYRALRGQDRTLKADEIYLIDSGGQYLGGTTDITRTIWTGPQAPPHDLRAAYTRVLKGHILLARARFPIGTTGHQLDSLARYALWQGGLDYDHGTGHGIGNYLSVHEGPQNIGTSAKPVALEEGMIVSNEPGYYLAGHYGIRLENLLLVQSSSSSTSKEFLEFEVLSFAPFDRALIMPCLLEPEEKSWLNDYHAKALTLNRPRLSEGCGHWLEAARSFID